MAACNRYLAHAPRDFITFEYCMLDGVNDQPEHARQLVDLVRKHSTGGRLVQVQPHPLQSLSRIRSVAFAAKPGHGLRKNPV